MSTKPTKHSHILMSLSSCHQEPPWQRQEGTSGGSPIESGKTGCTCSYVSLYVKHHTCSSESSISDLPWHADNKKAETELSPQDKKSQRTAIITGFISVAVGVSGSTAIPQKTMPEGGICCSTVQWSSCRTYCRDVCSSTAPASAAQCHALYITSINISIASYHRFTAGRLHGIKDQLQKAYQRALCHRWHIFC